MDYKLLTNSLINEVIDNAKNDKRKRKNYNFHNLSDNVQRMLNAIEPDSYIRPHKHINPPKIEFFIVLKGKFYVVFFNENGEIYDVVYLDGKKNIGIDIKPGVIHSLISLKKGGVIFETKDGPYDPSTDKKFPDWAPLENTIESYNYLKKLKIKAKLFYKLKYKN